MEVISSLSLLPILHLHILTVLDEYSRQPSSYILMITLKGRRSLRYSENVQKMTMKELIVVVTSRGFVCCQTIAAPQRRPTVSFGKTFSTAFRQLFTPLFPRFLSVFPSVIVTYSYSSQLYIIYIYIGRNNNYPMKCE